MNNKRFVDLLTMRLKSTIEERSKYESNSPMYYYFDGKAVAYQAALDYYSICEE